MVQLTIFPKMSLKPCTTLTDPLRLTASMLSFKCMGLLSAVTGPSSDRPQQRQVRLLCNHCSVVWPLQLGCSTVSETWSSSTPPYHSEWQPQARAQGTNIGSKAPNAKPVEQGYT